MCIFRASGPVKEGAAQLAVSVGRSICDKPRRYYFCGRDKYLRLVKHTVSQRTFPIMEDDGYFLYVRSGHGKFILNGVEFDVVPGCVCWIQCSHVLTIAPSPGSALELWSLVYDYQLSSFLMFRAASNAEKKSVVWGTPILYPENPATPKIIERFEHFKVVDDWTSYGTSLIKVGILGQISILFAKGADCADAPPETEWPLGWRACIYIASLSMDPNENTETTAAKLGVDVSALNRAVRMVTGMNGDQLFSRLKCVMASSFFLFENLPLDYIAVHSGFKSDVTFYRCFKKTMGMTPREYRDNSLYDKGSRYRGLSMDETLVAVVNYLYSNLSEQITMDGMAKALFTSDSIIRKLLDETFGVSYKQILSLFRIRYSESLLASTNLPILDISVMVGFNSDRTYSRVFSSINGISPSEYRQFCRRIRSDTNGKQ